MLTVNALDNHFISETNLTIWLSQQSATWDFCSTGCNQSAYAESTTLSKYYSWYHNSLM